MPFWQNSAIGSGKSEQVKLPYPTSSRYPSWFQSPCSTLNASPTDRWEVGCSIYGRSSPKFLLLFSAQLQSWCRTLNEVQQLCPPFPLRPLFHLWYKPAPWGLMQVGSLMGKVFPFPRLLAHYPGVHCPSQTVPVGFGCPAFPGHRSSQDHFPLPLPACLVSSRAPWQRCPALYCLSWMGVVLLNWPPPKKVLRGVGQEG